MDNKIKVKSLEYHRNGVGGEGFYVAIFDDSDNGEMMGVIFPLSKEDEFKFYGERKPKFGGRVHESWNGRVAIFKTSLIAQGNIKFGINSWRGDTYEAQLRQAIKQHEDEQYKQQLLFLKGVL